MTDEEKLKNVLALDAAYARAEACDSALSGEDKLDAYGHLNWTVGNEDWLACFDAIRVPDGIAYHVVVDCESGGFTDTLASGTVAVDAAIDQLAGLPDYWADICAEHYIDRPEMVPDYKEVAECRESWAAYLRGLVAEPAPEPDEELSDWYAEVRKAALNHRGEP